jgi:hypothetical protein
MYAASGSEHYMRNVGFWTSPFLDCFYSRLLRQFRNLDSSNLLTIPERVPGVPKANAGIGLQHLLRQKNVAFPDLRLFTCPIKWIILRMKKSYDQQQPIFTLGKHA